MEAEAHLDGNADTRQTGACLPDGEIGAGQARVIALELRASL